MIATILSAQCTDVRVNMVTPVLFKKYRTAADFAAAKRGDLEKAIQSTGFFRNKAKSIQECCRKLAEEYGGKVPNTLEELVELPGVGRKTANVVLGTALWNCLGSRRRYARCATYLSVGADKTKGSGENRKRLDGAIAAARMGEFCSSIDSSRAANLHCSQTALRRVRAE